MQSIILGIIVTQQPSTTLTVALPKSDVMATAMIAAQPSKPFASIPRIDDPTGARFEIALPPGQYALVVDSVVRPGDASEFTVTTSASATFWSAEHPDPNTTPRPWHLSAGTVVALTDPKDPWPKPSTTPIPPATATTLVQTSPILQIMSDLVDANAGRGPDPARPAPTVRALLIGIDRYEPSSDPNTTIYRSLRGCVTDVLEIEALLRSKLANVEVTRLLAPRVDGPGRDLVIAPDEVPTYPNIVAAWQRIVAAAGPDDLIYIHYSGHGGRVKTAFPDIKLGGVDEALVPCNINDRAHGRYLRDVELALLLQRLADRNIKTVLVLDSCHAGGATRRGDQAWVRTRDDDEADRDERGADALASAVGTVAELNAHAKALESSPTNPTWKLDAFGRLTSAVTVLAACSATEGAYEYAPERGRICGALTYFWRRALAQLRPGTTYRRAFVQVFNGVHGAFSNQTPVLLGQPDRVVLGTQVLATRPALRVREVVGDLVTLDAGAALQINNGSTLAIVPDDQLPELVDLAQLVAVEVFDHSATTAQARRIDGTGNDAAIEVGARAVVRSFPPRLQRGVRIVAPASLADMLAAAITDDPTKLLSVTVSRGSDFQVLVDETTLVAELTNANGAAFPHVPSTPVTATDAVATIVDRLVHLARYRNVREFTNCDPGASLANLLGAELFRHELPNMPVIGALRVNHGERFGLRLTNQSASPLTYYLLNLRPDWSIVLLNPDGDVLQPGVAVVRTITGSVHDTLVRHITASAVDTQNVTCSDVISVLATRSALDASLLTLAPLGGQPIPRSARGPGESPLQALARALQDPLVVRRHAGVEETPSTGWTVAQVEFETSRALAPTRDASGGPDRGASAGAATAPALV